MINVVADGSLHMTHMTRVLISSTLVVTSGWRRVVSPIWPGGTIRDFDGCWRWQSFCNKFPNGLTSSLTLKMLSIVAENEGFQRCTRPTSHVTRWCTKWLRTVFNFITDGNCAWHAEDRTRYQRWLTSSFMMKVFILAADQLEAWLAGVPKHYQVWLVSSPMDMTRDAPMLENIFNDEKLRQQRWGYLY